LVFTDFSSFNQKREKNIYPKEQYRHHYLSPKITRELKKRAEKRLKEIEMYLPQKGRLLDIGCSYGHFIKVAQKRKWDVWGVDLNEEAILYLKKDYHQKVLAQDVLKIKLPACYFDLITLWDVLEHLPQPFLTLKKIRFWLKDKGLLALQVPNINSLTARITKEKWPWLTPSDHLFHFSPKTIKKLLEKSNFKVIKLKTWVNYKDFVHNLLAVFYKKKGGQLNIIFYYLGSLLAFILFPLLIPFVFLISKLLLGDLIIVYALKNNA
jgi:2-polyprenyl-3-methyl-5-hydroxy-6-metoxy-1,4-benzoquinol methylase